MIGIFNGRMRTLGGEKPEIYIKVSVDFCRRHLRHFKGAKLHVFLAIASHINEEGWAWPSYKLLQQETGYERNTIAKALTELCETVIDGKRVLLRHQPTAHHGHFDSNRYLIFPSDEDVARYAPCTKNRDTVPCTTFPDTVKPYTENRYTKKNQLQNKNHVEPEPELPCADARDGVSDSSPSEASPSEPSVVHSEPDFDALFPPSEEPVDLHGPFKVPEGMTVQEYVRQRGDRLHAKMYGTPQEIPWGSESPAFEKYLQRPDVDAVRTRALGAFLDCELALVPVWAHRSDVLGWCKGLVELGQAAEWDHGIVKEAYGKMSEEKLIVSSPFSLVKVARALAHQKRKEERDRRERKERQDRVPDEQFETAVNDFLGF